MLQLFNKKTFFLLTLYSLLLLSGETTAQTSSPNKGKVRQSFEDAVESGKSGHDRVLPGERTYSIRSPDNKLLLTYTYDYTQPALLIKGEVSGGQAVRFELPVDDGFTSHGLFLNNRGEIFAITTDEQDAFYLIRYHPQTDQSQMLEVGPGGSRRNRFMPFFDSGGKVYVANVAENRAGEFAGVMLSVFDFEKYRVEGVQFHPVSADLEARMSSKLPEGRFDLVQFEVKPGGEKVLELEKRTIAANNYRYDPYAVNDPASWQPRKQQVQTGEKITIRLDAGGKALSEEVFDNFRSQR
jgi:hypothetical protein